MGDARQGRVPSSGDPSALIRVRSHPRANLPLVKDFCAELRALGGRGYPAARGEPSAHRGHQPVAPQMPSTWKALLAQLPKVGKGKEVHALRLWLVDFESLPENAEQLRLGPRMPLPGGHRGEVPGGMACGQSSSHS